MSSREVKEYLSHHLIPQLLESLLTGLLYHHPEDPVSFLQGCLMRTRQLGGPEAITWDTFIHMDRHQMKPGPPKTHPGSPRTTSVPTTAPALPPPPLTPPVVPKTKPSVIPPIPPRPSTTPHPPALITPQRPPSAQATSSILQPLPLLPPIIPQVPTPSTAAPLTRPGLQVSFIKPRTPVLPPPTLTHSGSSLQDKTPCISPQAATGPTLLLPAPSGPAGTPPAPPPVHTEVKDEATQTGSSEVWSQLSIDSDSDMTESSGLLQEVSIPPPQRPYPLTIFIIGGPGSGKGSQTARLARCFSLRAVSLDELLRKQLLSHASPSRKWEVISEMMSHGELGPQEDTISELRRQLIGQQEVRGFIVDGFPRNVHQALSFQEQIGSPDLVLLLLCSSDTLSCRLQLRASQLGLLGDSSHTFQRRLDTFHRDIVSLRRYYRQTHLLTQVDADRDEETVFAHLSSVIREKLHLKDQSDPTHIPECSSAVADVPFKIRSVNQ